MDQGMIYWIQLYVNFNSKFESFNNEIIDALSSNLDILKAKIIDPFFFSILNSAMVKFLNSLYLFL